MHIEFWYWWVLAFGLLAVELTLVGSFFLLAISVAAAVVGVIAWVAPNMGWEVQFSYFAGLSLVAILLWWKFRPAKSKGPDAADSLNRRGTHYVGRIFTLDDPITNGVGKLRVDDTQWRATGNDAPSGTRVKVLRVDGATLIVEAVSGD